LSLLFTSSRAAKRRGDPDVLDLPVPGKKANEKYHGFGLMASQRRVTQSSLLEVPVPGMKAKMKYHRGRGDL
jgi:hypothetical protein